MSRKTSPGKSGLKTKPASAEKRPDRSREELEQRVAELEAKNAEQTHKCQVLRTLIDNLPDGIYVKDAAGRKILANPADLKAMKCKTEAEALGKSDFDFYPKDIAAHFFADDQKVIQGQPVINREEYVLDKAGQKRWLLTTKLPLRDAGGKIVGLVGVGRDITEQRQAEESLARERRFLRALIDNLPDLVFIKDTQSRFVTVNPACVSQLGAGRPEAVLGKTDADFVAPELAEQYLADEQALMQSGQMVNKEEPTQHKGTGEMRWSLTTKIPLRDEAGKIMGLMGIARDITRQKRAEAALRQSHDDLEKRVVERTTELARERLVLRTLIDNLPDAIYTKDTAGRKTLANPADLKNLRCQTEAEALGKTDFDLFSADIAAKFFADDQKVIQGQPVINREEFFFDEACQKRWLLTSKLPLCDPNGTIIGLVGIGRDITARKQAEDKLAYERELFQTLLETIPDNIYFKDRESRIVRASRSKVEATLQTVRESYRATHPEAGPVERPAHLASVESFGEWLIGKTDFDTYPEEHARAAYEDEQGIMRTGQPIVGKLQKATLPDGKSVWWFSTKVPWRDKDGNIIGTFGISSDVTAIKEAEETLIRERLILRTLIDNLPDCIYAKDTAGRKTLANPADLKNLRCQTEAEAVGKSDFDLFPPDIAAKFFADDQKVIQGQPVINREEFFFDEAGRKRWLLTSKLPMRDASGIVVGLMGIGRDITSLKEAEESLERTHRQLLETSRLAGMAEVATDVLHNVGNVLNSVNVSAALISERLRESKTTGVAKLAKLLLEHSAELGRFMMEDKRGREVPSYLEQLAKHLDRERHDLRDELKNLTVNIEHIKEIVTTQQNYERIAGLTESVTLPELMEDALRIHGAAYTRHGLTVAREYESLPAISVDKHKVLQIVVNLLSNAKYACDDGSKKEKQVIARLKPAGEGRVKIEVADNGVGIAPENLTRIFAQGFTLRKGGHGFGLHSGALAARDLGGSLSVHSDGLGRGATFILELPITPPAQNQPGKLLAEP